MNWYNAGSFLFHSSCTTFPPTSLPLSSFVLHPTSCVSFIPFPPRLSTASAAVFFFFFFFFSSFSVSEHRVTSFRSLLFHLFFFYFLFVGPLCPTRNDSLIVSGWNVLKDWCIFYLVEISRKFSRWENKSRCFLYRHLERGDDSWLSLKFVFVCLLMKKHGVEIPRIEMDNMKKWKSYSNSTIVFGIMLMLNFVKTNFHQDSAFSEMIFL